MYSPYGEGLLAVNVANTLTHKWSTFDDTDRVTDRASPNYQGSHQIPSVRRTAGVGSSFPSDIFVRRQGYITPSDSESSVTIRRIQTPRRHIFVFTSECPRTYKGVGSPPRRKPHPAGVCTITTERPGTYKGSGSSRPAVPITTITRVKPSSAQSPVGSTRRGVRGRM